MLELLPESMKVGDMVPDDVGTWLFHYHVNDHITAGMLALYTVSA
jgi:manganese oxidase